MISPFKNHPLLKLLFSLLVFQVAPARAEMNFRDMKGIHALISPEYEYLSPIYGLTLLGTKTLENMRFHGNYGPKKEGIGCLERAPQIHEILVSRQDCPQDKTSELIQRFFPSHDHVNLVPNQVDSDPISHWSPQTLGALIRWLADVKTSTLEDSDQIGPLKSELADLLFEESNPQSYYENHRKALVARQKEIKNLSRNKKAQCSGDCLAQELLSLEKRLSSIQTSLKQFSSRKPEELKKGRGKEADFQVIADLLVETLLESRLPHQTYPKHLTEHVLLAFFWKRANSKTDFLPLLTGMKMEHGPERLAQFLTQRYSKSEYEAEVETLYGDPKVLARKLLENPEKLVYLVEQDKFVSKLIPPLLSYSQASHSSLDQVKYSDCGETSLRNFFNIVLYDRSSGLFNVDFLRQLQKNNSSLHSDPALLSFYEKNLDPAASVSEEVRNEWSEGVTSRRRGIHYNKPVQAPQCEISSEGGGLDNMLNLLDQLLFGELDSAKERSPARSVHGREDRINRLCQALSREGYQFDWNLVGVADPLQGRSQIDKMGEYIDLEFSINGKPSFVWSFKQGHFLVSEIPETRKSWKNRVAQEISHQMVEAYNGERSRARAPSPMILLHWFVSPDNWVQLIKNQYHVVPIAEQIHLLDALPLSSNEVKLSVFEGILENQFTHMYPVAKRLQSKLPENDWHIQYSIQAALANSDYPQPWGDPPHAFGKPEVIYKRVGLNSHLSSQFLKEYGAFLDQAWQGPQGLIWLGPLGESASQKYSTQVEPKKSNWEEAKNYCFGLNPPENRKKLEAYIESLEKNKKLMNLRNTYITHFNEANRTALVKYFEETKAHRPVGCFLPPLEEFIQLGVDLGYNEVANKYMPQFLRRLYRNDGQWRFANFATSSASPKNYSNIFIFDALQGRANGGIDNFEYWVRCVCVPE